MAWSRHQADLLGIDRLLVEERGLHCWELARRHGHVWLAEDMRETVTRLHTNAFISEACNAVAASSSVAAPSVLMPQRTPARKIAAAC